MLADTGLWPDHFGAKRTTSRLTIGDQLFFCAYGVRFSNQRSEDTDKRGEQDGEQEKTDSGTALVRSNDGRDK